MNATEAQKSLFSEIREALQDGAGAGDAQYIYPEAWAQLDRLESTLILLRGSYDMVDEAKLDTAQKWARHGQRTVLELVEDAVHG